MEAKIEITEAVLEKFNSPFVIRQRQMPALTAGQVLVRITASGICGSDLQMCQGKDPGLRLPLVLGHEGVGLVEELSHQKKDVFGRPLNKGHVIIWDRGHTCGRCSYCTVKNQPYLCPYREVYGITEDGCYATHLILKARTRIMKIDREIKPELLAPAGCSGATAAHAVEQARIKPGDTVVIYGPGPMGIFATAMSSQQGASNVIVVGTRRSQGRLDLSYEFGATDTLTIDGMSMEERMAFIKDKTHGLGADVVIDCAGTNSSIEEGIKMLVRGGSYLLPGLATPAGKTVVDFYEDVVRANIRIQGIWVNDTSHLYQAVQLILTGRYPFQKVITHLFCLKEINHAMELVANRQALKAVLIP